MYSHVAKGYTTGSAVTRRVLRTIFELPGGLVDAILIAPFYKNGYKAFWTESYMDYPDGTRIGGFFRCITGWIGDRIGCITGAVAGATLGAICYIPDAILLATCWLHDNICAGLSRFSKIIADSTLFKDVSIKEPTNYLEKAWNISVGTIGGVLGGIPWIVVRGIEKFLPFMGNGLSDAVLNIGAFLGGTLGSITAIAVSPFIYTCQKAVEFYRGLRSHVRSATAFVYAKTGQNLYKKEPTYFLPDEAVHSEGFCQIVVEYKKHSTTEILFGLSVNSTSEERASLMSKRPEPLLPPPPQRPPPTAPDKAEVADASCQTISEDLPADAASLYATLY